MIEINLRITAPSEETLRRAMDEIMDAAIRSEQRADACRRTNAPSDVQRAKHFKMAERHEAVTKVLGDIADAIDHAEPRIIR